MKAISTMFLLLQYPRSLLESCGLTMRNIVEKIVFLLIVASLFVDIVDIEGSKNKI